MTTAFIIDGLRSPIGRRGGSLKGIHAVDLLGLVIEKLFERNLIDPNDVDDVIAGCVSQIGEQTGNVGRNAALAAGLPETVPGTTVDRQCGSSQQALHFAAQGIMAGSYDVAIACGVEMMSRVPMGSTFSYEGPEGTSTAFGPKMYERYPGLVPQGLSAEMMAVKWNLDREELDKISYSSHQRALNAKEKGYFDQQIHKLPDVLEKDEGVRPETTLDILAGLDPAFTTDGVITAGNSSQISDGAAALLLASEETVNKHGLNPIAKINAMSVVGTDPVLMLSGPIPATKKVLESAKLKPEQIDLVEINEAFSSVVGSWRKEYPQIDYEKVNANGGAIAIGHPLGATGARLMINLIHDLKRQNLKYGLQAICEGGGTANGTIIELV
jgi:acetyl-CoA acetyltransferase family protein